MKVDWNLDFLGTSATFQPSLISALEFQLYQLIKEPAFTATVQFKNKNSCGSAVQNCLLLRPQSCFQNLTNSKKVETKSINLWLLKFNHLGLFKTRLNIKYSRGNGSLIEVQKRKRSARAIASPINTHTQKKFSCRMTKTIYLHFPLLGSSPFK